jgi:hypothetical protein
VKNQKIDFRLREMTRAHDAACRRNFWVSQEFIPVKTETIKKMRLILRSSTEVLEKSVCIRSLCVRIAQKLLFQENCYSVQWSKTLLKSCGLSGK